MHSDVTNILLSIFLNFLSWSGEFYAVQSEATKQRDHGRVEPRCFSIRHTDRIDSNRFAHLMDSNRRIDHSQLSIAYLYNNSMMRWTVDSW